MMHAGIPKCVLAIIIMAVVQERDRSMSEAQHSLYKTVVPAIIFTVP